MNSLWLAVEDDYEYDVDDSNSIESGSFMGVFNQRPEDIAKWLPRPATPFNSHNQIQSKFQDAFFVKNVQAACSQPDDFGSFSNFGGRTTVSAVSVF